VTGTIRQKEKAACAIGQVNNNDKEMAGPVFGDIFKVGSGTPAMGTSPENGKDEKTGR
jgi:hypothetical protein